MQVFTAYEKAGPAGGGSDADVVLIKEGGSFAAMALPFIWPFYRGLWIVLGGQIVLAAALVAAAIFVPGTGLAVIVAALAFMALMGAHANDLRRWTLRMRGYVFSGVVAGADMAEAEQRLFTALGPHIYLP